MLACYDILLPSAASVLLLVDTKLVYRRCIWALHHPQDFFIDLIFGPVDENYTEVTTTPASEDGGATTANTASQRRDRGMVVNVEDKDNYDAMLHKDTRSVGTLGSEREGGRVRKQRGGGGEGEHPVKA